MLLAAQNSLVGFFSKAVEGVAENFVTIFDRTFEKFFSRFKIQNFPGADSFRQNLVGFCQLFGTFS